MIVYSVIEAILAEPKLSALNDKVRPFLAQPDALPYCTVERYSATLPITHGGPTNLTTSGVTITITSKDDKQASQMVEDVINLFHGFRGNLQGTEVARIAASIKGKATRTIQAGGDSWKHTHTIDLQIVHRQS